MLRSTAPFSKAPARTIARKSFRMWRSTIRSSIADINSSCGSGRRRGMLAPVLQCRPQTAILFSGSVTTWGTKQWR